MGVDWDEILGLMEVSAMLYKCTYCVFILNDRTEANKDVLWGYVQPCLFHVQVSFHIFVHLWHCTNHFIFSHSKLNERTSNCFIYTTSLLRLPKCTNHIKIIASFCQWSHRQTVNHTYCYHCKERSRIGLEYTLHPRSASFGVEVRVRVKIRD